MGGGRVEEDSKDCLTAGSWSCLKNLGISDIEWTKVGTDIAGLTNSKGTIPPTHPLAFIVLAKARRFAATKIQSSDRVGPLRVEKFAQAGHDVASLLKVSQATVSLIVEHERRWYGGNAGDLIGEAARFLEDFDPDTYGDICRFVREHRCFKGGMERSPDEGSLVEEGSQDRVTAIAQELTSHIQNLGISGTEWTMVETEIVKSPTKRQISPTHPMPFKVLGTARRLAMAIILQSSDRLNAGFKYLNVAQFAQMGFDVASLLKVSKAIVSLIVDHESRWHGASAGGDPVQEAARFLKVVDRETYGGVCRFVHREISEAMC